MHRSTPEPGRRLMDLLEQVTMPHEHAVAPCVPKRKTFQPLVDVKETHREVVVFADIPGMDEDDIDIRLEEDALVISGVRDFDLDAEDPEEYLRIERPYGGFQVEVPLPAPVDFEFATAKYKRGVLKVRLPKRVAVIRRATEKERD